MTAPSAATKCPAASAFDGMAEDYDSIFTRSLIGRAQRDVVWKQAVQTFTMGDHVLELNCGTGEDALFLSRMGITVTACDASAQMIRRARYRRDVEARHAAVRFEILPTEELAHVPGPSWFDGVFSNFSGLNCVADLCAVNKQLSSRLRPGAPLLLCFSTRYCVWEMLWFLAHGKFRRAFRRCSGRTTVTLGASAVPVYYPTLRQLRRTFLPAFTLCSCTGVGITVPPSYLEPWARRCPRALSMLRRLDRRLCKWPWFRVVGDHMLLHFEKVTP